MASVKEGAAVTSSAEWAYRSCPSIDSTATQHSSHAPTSANPQISGESIPCTDDGFDAHHDAFVRRFQTYVTLNPHNRLEEEQDAAMPKDAGTSAPLLPNTSEGATLSHCVNLQCFGASQVYVPVIVIDSNTPVGCSGASLPSCGGHGNLGFQQSSGNHRERSRSPSKASTKKPNKTLTWEEQREKRVDSVDRLKATEHYTQNQLISESKRPHTPDPSIKSPKRKWEKQIAHCRLMWRRIHGVRQLVEMGFTEQQATTAWERLERYSNTLPTVDQALDIL